MLKHKQKFSGKLNIKKENKVVKIHYHAINIFPHYELPLL